jgi:subtilisin-like proprotein convertase family protein
MSYLLEKDKVKEEIRAKVISGIIEEVFSSPVDSYNIETNLSYSDINLTDRLSKITSSKWKVQAENKINFFGNSVAVKDNGDFSVSSSPVDQIGDVKIKTPYDEMVLNVGYKLEVKGDSSSGVSKKHTFLFAPGLVSYTDNGDKPDDVEFGFTAQAGLKSKALSGDSGSIGGKLEFVTATLEYKGEKNERRLNFKSAAEFGVTDEITVGREVVAQSEDVTISRDELKLLSNTIDGKPIIAPPVVLDLDGDGVELISFNDSSTFIDYDNDGFAEQTGWVAADDGLLAIDLDNDGAVSGPNEFVFVDGTIEGETDLEAIKRRFDSNSDGKLDAQDTRWNEFVVWQDLDQDGESDDGEVRALSQIGITSINLLPSTQNQQAVEDGGNIIYNSGSYEVFDAVTETVVTRNLSDVGFGYSELGIQKTYLDVSHYEIEVQGGDKFFYAENGADSNLDVGSQGYSVAYGEDGKDYFYTTTDAAVHMEGWGGDDTLIGGVGADFLYGGIGSDSLVAGDGDDVLVVDGDDVFIDGGAGRDSVIIDVNENTIIDFTNTNVESVQGSFYNDQITYNTALDIEVFGGSGNDHIIVSDGEDLLSGGNGNDTLIAGGGDDFIFGDAGDDVVFGGDGDDIIYGDAALGDGSTGSDILYGGDGNDTLIADAEIHHDLNGKEIVDNIEEASNTLVGGKGDDFIKGGLGNDVAIYSGDKSDYEVLVERGYAIVRDLRTVAENDGVDILSKIDELRFADQTVILDTNLAPEAVHDMNAGNVRSGEKIVITASSLLENDYDENGDTLSISSVEFKGDHGHAYLNEDGDIVFVAEEGYAGDASFEYEITDGNGVFSRANAHVLVKKELPNDPGLAQQWHHYITKTVEVWDDYTGDGVKIADVEYGTVEKSHEDLVANYSSEWDVDNGGSLYNDHATAVLGIIGADNNGIGGVGVAFDAEIGLIHRGSWDDWSDSLNNVGASNVDVANLIGNYNQPFEYNFNEAPFSSWEVPLQSIAENGRNGLGTAMTVTGGNQRNSLTHSANDVFYHANSSNYDNFVNSRYTIAVGAVTYTEEYTFSSPGANLLVTAPGVDIFTTDLTGSDGYNDGRDPEDANYTWFGGTCGGTPVVSGIIGLMYEANVSLGYRDVQEILAYSATQNDIVNNSWNFNGATNWNGGGLHVSNDYGFGLVNAHAAVRLAENWQTQSTAANEVATTISSSPGLVIDDLSTVSDTVSIPNSFEIDQIEVELDIYHTNIGDLIVSIISPDGTESVLLDRAGKDPYDENDTGLESNSLQFKFSSTHHWGEQTAGDWTLKVLDANGNNTGVLNSWKLNIYGDENSNDDVYIYTDEFSEVSSAAGSLIADADGVDTLNASAVTSDSSVDLKSGNVSIIDDAVVSYSDETIIENAFTGDGNDRLTGNELANDLRAGRGNDTLSGGAGADSLDGGKGVDLASYFSVSDAATPPYVPDFSAG